MKVELPYSHVAVIEPKVETAEKPVTLQPLRYKKEPEPVLRNKPKSRAEYMRQFRKKPKLCPHCGKDIRANLGSSG